MKIDGRCHCGNIAYEAVVDPDAVGICHCTDCQTLSGSGYRAVVAVTAANFRLLRGEPKIYVKTADSGAKLAQAFCLDCGTPIYASAVADPPVYSLRIGAISQRRELRPGRQIWCRSALPWSMDLHRIAMIDGQP
ncbi:MAG TPA: GFA family protein [Candidatus Cybelea sp.]|nr:GFA family protein [Candidatus Cybelea sp.]